MLHLSFDHTGNVYLKGKLEYQIFHFLINKIITKIIKKFIIKNTYTKHLCVGVGGLREAEIDE